MSSELPSVAFHIGAHKTATSHLQRCLMNASDALALHGVRFLGPQFFRRPGQSIPATFGMRDHKTAPKRLQQIADGAERLLLSEENFIGRLNDPDEAEILQRYPEAGSRVGALASAIGRDIDVFLAVRRPTDFLNSGYYQMLLSGHVPTFAAYRDANPEGSVDWYSVIDGLRATSGVGSITVWRYEDYLQVFDQIVGRMVGKTAAAAVQHIPRKINLGLSQAAVAQLIDEAPLSDPTRGHKLRGILPISESEPRFDGFTPGEHAQSASVYEHQLKLISQKEGVTVLRPETD